MDIANELRERGVLDEEECFIDATFVMAKGGGGEATVKTRMFYARRKLASLVAAG
jgi:hypothetical protein